jgi:phosphate:Na+ symporter
MLVSLGTAAGGLGLFLLGMHLMTDGLKLAAGRALKRALELSTRTPLIALATGVLSTALVQSSSAMTVATIGFVNAGLLELSQAIWIVFGSNVGTTMTAWLVALTGLELDLGVWALPGIGAGMFLWLTGRAHRRGAIGQAIAGFGLFFLGLGFMQTAFGGLTDAFDPADLHASGPLGVALYVVIGVVLTVVTQSSSAALAITLTAADSGAIPLVNAGAMVIGANLGTTSTAALSAIDATPNARRTAAAHVVFNVLAAVVALALLPFLLEAIGSALDDDGAGRAAPAVALAAFHTVFNVLGVLLVWPFAGRLVRTLSRRFTTAEEEAARPRFLDANVLSVPDLALEAARREMARAGSLVARALLTAIAPEPPTRETLERELGPARALTRAVSAYVTRLDRAAMTEDVAHALQALVRTAHHYAIAMEQAELIVTQRLDASAAEAGSTTIPSVLEAARGVVALADPERDGGIDPTRATEAFGALSERIAETRRDYEASAARGKRETDEALFRQRLLAEVRRGVKHLVRGLDGLTLPAPHS